jgi:DNA-binding response OmpR family regulator
MASSIPPRPRRVLLVDDNVDGLEAMALLLRNMGYTVDVAVTGRAALELARRLRPDVLFLDLGLPDIYGCDLAEQLRHEPGLERLRIFALTALTSEEHRLRAVQAGIDQYLVKPVDMKFLESLLRPDVSP